MADIADFHRGDTKQYRIEIKDAAGDPVPIAGDDIWVTLKESEADDDASAALQVQHTVPAGADADNGIATVVLASDKTDPVPPGRYYYDFQWVQPGTPPQVRTILSGKVRVLADITRSTA